MTGTPTGTKSSTPTPTRSKTASPALTHTQTPTKTITRTKTGTPALTRTKTGTPAVTKTKTGTPTARAAAHLMSITENLAASFSASALKKSRPRKLKSTDTPVVPRVRPTTVASFHRAEEPVSGSVQ